MSSNCSYRFGFTWRIPRLPVKYGEPDLPGWLLRLLTICSINFRQSHPYRVSLFDLHAAHDALTISISKANVSLDGAELLRWIRGRLRRLQQGDGKCVRVGVYDGVRRASHAPA